MNAKRYTDAKDYADACNAILTLNQRITPYLRPVATSTPTPERKARAYLRFQTQLGTQKDQSR